MSYTHKPNTQGNDPFLGFTGAIDRRTLIEGPFGEKAEPHRVSVWEMWARKGPGESRDPGAETGMRRPPESCPSSHLLPQVAWFQVVAVPEMWPLLFPFLQTRILRDRH